MNNHKSEYGVIQTIRFMIRQAEKEAPAVLVWLVVDAILALILQLLELYVTPVLLRDIEEQIALKELVTTILFFSSGILLLTGLKEYINNATYQGKIEIRMSLCKAITEKIGATSYCNLGKKDFQEKKVRRNRTARKCGETAETAKKKKTSLIQKIKYTYQTMCDKVKVLLDKKEKLTEFLSEPIHKAAWIRLKREAFRILRFLRPKKLTGSVQFGLEDPYNTGRALAVLSMLYPLYGEHIDIYPNFEQQVLEGHLLIKGRIRGIYAVIVLWNLFFDKQIRTTYEHIKTFKL